TFTASASQGADGSSPAFAGPPPSVPANPPPRRSDGGTVSPSLGSVPFFLAEDSSAAQPPAMLANPSFSMLPEATPCRDELVSRSAAESGSHAHEGDESGGRRRERGGRDEPGASAPGHRCYLHGRESVEEGLGHYPLALDRREN